MKRRRASSWLHPTFWTFLTSKKEFRDVVDHYELRQSPWDEGGGGWVSLVDEMATSSSSPPSFLPRLAASRRLHLSLNLSRDPS